VPWAFAISSFEVSEGGAVLVMGGQAHFSGTLTTIADQAPMYMFFPVSRRELAPNRWPTGEG
jgi:hypothetical protein